MQWNDFLNPRSMLTPGIAGSIVMVIANTLWVEFMVPQKWSALVLSFLLLIPILARFSAKLYENIIYFIFNGLIIFALAVNTNFAGGKIQEAVSGEGRNISLQNVPSSFQHSMNDDKADTNIKRLQIALNEVQSSPAVIIAESKQQNIKDSNHENYSSDGSKEKPKKDQKNSSEPERKFFNNWFD